MLHQEKIVIAQHRIPDETTETTQVKELLEPVNLDGAVVTADAAHAQRETAAYIAGSTQDGNRGSDYFLFVKANQPSLQKAIFDAIQHDGPREADHAELDYGHGRIIRRSIWVADASGIDFPHATRIVRIRRDRYDITGSLISKEIVHAVTSLDAGQASPADLAAIARGQWGIEVRHEVAPVSEITGMEAGCSAVSSGRVLDARSRSWHAPLATAGCEAREEARGPAFHPLVTGKGKAGRANKVNSRRLRYPELRKREAGPEDRTRRRKAAVVAGASMPVM